MNVGNPNDLVAGFVKKSRGHRTDIAKPLNDDARVHPEHTEFSERSVAIDEHASPRGFVTATRSSEVDGFAGDDGGLGVPYVHGIRVHDPGHGLFVGAEIGSRYVALRTEPLDELSGIPARDALQFAMRQFLRIANHAAFCSAKRNVNH